MDRTISSMLIIVDYGMGNLNSIKNMIKKIGGSAEISSDRAAIKDATKLILPGVGAFDNGMRNLKEKGMIDLLGDKVLNERTPILGICLGMKLFTNRSEEGVLPGLGWIEAETKRFDFDPNPNRLKIPHMGWNIVEPVDSSDLFRGFSEQEEARFYFVHSYHVVCQNPQNVLASANYGFDFTCSVRNGNIFGTQFHPEKSHRFGMKLTQNFLDIPEDFMSRES